MSHLDLRDLLKRGNELEAHLDSLSKDQPELQAYLNDIRSWLTQCVDYGQYLPDP